MRTLLRPQLHREMAKDGQRLLSHVPRQGRQKGHQVQYKNVITDINYQTNQAKKVRAIQ